MGRCKRSLYPRDEVLLLTSQISHGEQRGCCLLLGGSSAGKAVVVLALGEHQLERQVSAGLGKSQRLCSLFGYGFCPVCAMPEPQVFDMAFPSSQGVEASPHVWG